MIQAIVTPLNENFDMSVSLPADYVGKKVHVLFFIDDEVNSTSAAILPRKKPSDFFGILSKEEGENLIYTFNKCVVNGKEIFDRYKRHLALIFRQIASEW